MLIIFFQIDAIDKGRIFSKGQIVIKFSFCIFLILFLTSLEAFSQIPPLEREALIALYDSTNGDGWTDNSGWKDGPLDTDDFAMPGTECGWYGITCNTENNSVEEIYLFANNLSGLIPPELGNLSSLSYLELSVNQLTGSIPLQLGNLNKLYALRIFANELTGSIPAELGNLNNLSILELQWNQLTGSIPLELGNLSNLIHLAIFTNKLTGSIPPELGNLGNLYKLLLSVNNLTGSIPSELGNMNSLSELALDGNKLTGSIPPELGNLSNLEDLRLFGNQLWGCIPTSLSNCDELRTLYIDDNELSGEIPLELMDLTNLENDKSDIRGNYLYTTDTDLKEFLDQKQIDGDWESYQNFDTNLPMIEPSANCGVYTSGNCFASFEDAFTFSTSPSVIFVGEGEYQENVVVETGFSLELGWAHDFSCNPPTGPVIILGSVTAD